MNKTTENACIKTRYYSFMIHRFKMVLKHCLFSSYSEIIDHLIIRNRLYLIKSFFNIFFSVVTGDRTLSLDGP